MSAAKITTNLPLHADLIPLELATDVALTDCNHKNHPSWRQSKSANITGSSSSFIIVSTLSCERAKTNIKEFSKYEILIVAGNDLYAVT